MAAEVGEGAVEAVGAAGFADVAAVEDEPMVGLGDDFRGDVADEFALSLERGFAAGGETEALADAEDVSIHGHCRLIPDNGKNDVGSLAPHSRERHQLVNIRGDLAAEFVNEPARHPNQRLGLVIRIRNGADEFKDLLLSGGGESFCRWKRLKEGGSDLINPLVSALGREDYRTEQLKRRGKIQLGFSYGHSLLKPSNYGVITLL